MLLISIVRRVCRVPLVEVKHNPAGPKFVGPPPVAHYGTLVSTACGPRYWCLGSGLCAIGMFAKQSRVADEPKTTPKM